MSSLAVIKTKDDAAYMIVSTNNEYFKSKFADKLQSGLSFRVENVNLILTSDFSEKIPWNLIGNNKKKTQK